MLKEEIVEQVAQEIKVKYLQDIKDKVAYYEFLPNWGGKPCWKIFNDKYHLGWVSYYNAHTHSLDQALEQFKNETYGR